MAITQEEIEKAVARYLPDSLNYSQNASGDVDDEALFKKLLQMMALSLALDENSVTYLVYLSVQRLGNSVDAVISILTSLMGDQQLLAAGADDPLAESWAAPRPKALSSKSPETVATRIPRHRPRTAQRPRRRSRSPCC